MARKLRVEYPGAIYHVMSRGDKREDIFLDDVDRHDFIKTLAEACQKTDWQIQKQIAERLHLGKHKGARTGQPPQIMNNSMPRLPKSN